MIKDKMINEHPKVSSLHFIKNDETFLS